jgi:hypothetical protein
VRVCPVVNKYTVFITWSCFESRIVNIFFVNTDPNAAAWAMVDRHVIKMILETAQILSTAHRVLDGKEQTVKSKSGRNKKAYVLFDSREAILYSATHVNHPSTVWARQTSANYEWLLDHFYELAREYTYRYGKIHATVQKLGTSLNRLPKNIPAAKVITTIPSCMAPEFIVSNDPVTNYRNYYNKGKTNLHRWTRRLPPNWIEGEIVQDANKLIYTIKR